MVVMDKDRAEDLYQQASDAHENEDYESAGDLYMAALSHNQFHWESMRWLADVLLNLERYEDAIPWYEKTIEGDYTAGDANFFNDYGLCCYEICETLKAVRIYKQALEIEDHTIAHGNMGKGLYQLWQEGDKSNARTIAQWWVDKYPNNADAQHIGVAILGGQPPKTANADYVEETFDDFAEEFEEKLLNDLGYKAPQLLEQKVLQIMDSGHFNKRVIDLGCGTGLCGPWLFDYASELIGIDLSQRMLDYAGEKECYHKLEKAELTEWLYNNDPCHIGVAADVFCYIGDLLPVFTAWQKTALTGNRAGYLFFTVESCTADEAGNTGYNLPPSGRYRHSESYIHTVVPESGLQLVSCEQVTLRHEYGEDVGGYLVVAQKTK